MRVAPVASSWRSHRRSSWTIGSHQVQAAVSWPQVRTSFNLGARDCCLRRPANRRDVAVSPSYCGDSVTEQDSSEETEQKFGPERRCGRPRESALTTPAFSLHWPRIAWQLGRGELEVRVASEERVCFLEDGYSHYPGNYVPELSVFLIFCIRACSSSPLKVTWGLLTGDTTVNRYVRLTATPSATGIFGRRAICLAANGPKWQISE